MYGLGHKKLRNGKHRVCMASHLIQEDNRIDVVDMQMDGTHVQVGACLHSYPPTKVGFMRGESTLMEGTRM